MNLLITGAAKFNTNQTDALANLGFEIKFQSDEAGTPQTDFSCIDAVICNNLFLFHELDEFESLKFIQLTSAGLDRVPVDKINGKKIPLCNARGVYSVPIAEFVLGSILNLYKGYNDFYENKKLKVWEKNRNVRELNGSCATIIGCGSIGCECAARLKAFGVKTIAVDILKPNAVYFDEYYDISEVKKAVSTSDIVIFCLPLNAKTQGLADIEFFKACKDSATIVNISRGAIINEDDLISALRERYIGYAILDVFEKEPLSADSPLWEMENVTLTPHNSFVSEKNQERFFKLAYNNLKSFIKRGNEK